MSPRHESRLVCTLGAVAVAAGLTFAPLSARAQAAEPAPVEATGKGIAGGILLGAEIVMIPIAAAGVDDVWPYVVFGLVGAGGGAVGGAAAEGHFGGDPPAEVSLYMLAGGLALVIPTLVAILNATAYNPEDEMDEDGDAPDADADGDGEVDANINVETGSIRSTPMGGLIGVNAHGKHTRVGLGVPTVEVYNLYSEKEVASYGLEQDTEYRFPVVRGSF
jgi:hypothetical protein